MVRITKEWIFLIALLTNLVGVSLALSSDIKTWNPNTNFLDPRNWENEQLPCPNDRIIFPDSSAVITMMPESLAISEMVLPLNGEIIFPENANIELTGGKREGACTGKDVRFKVNVDYWYDPLNWNITSDRAFPRIPNRRNEAVPHALQVPCLTDTVRFPEKTTFQSHVIYPLTKVASMEINGESYTQSDFENLLNTHVGSLLFPDKPRMRITAEPCTDESGCSCENDGPRVKPTICNEVTPYCPELQCSDPITPVGNCCPICGARIIIKHRSGFKMDNLMTLHESFLNTEEYKKVESFTAKTFEGDIQSVFVDSEEFKGLANKVASKIHNVLNDASGAERYYVQSVSIYKSEAWNRGVITYDRLSSGMSSGGVAALIIVLIATAGLGAAFFIYKKRHVPGFDFARFDLRGGDKIEMELGTTPHDELQPVDPPGATGISSEEEKSKSFDNPVYGTAVEEQFNPKMEKMSSEADESFENKDFVENPMFMIFEK